MNIKIKLSDFDLEETLDCGQAFRFSKQPDGSFFGIVLDKPLHISKCDDGFILDGEGDEAFWLDYFDADTDYSELKKTYSSDKTLKDACEYASGIRLLKQDAFEALISFIISQNNNIPRIKGIIERLCENFGEECKGGYTFPTIERLSKVTVEELSVIRAGFRAKYIVDAVSKINSGEINLEEIKSMPIEDARKTLMTIKGVGPKVAECVLLYGMHRVEAFPLDVWMKRVMEKYYPDGFPEEFRKTAGIAQQYLFHFVRTKDKI